MKTEEHIKAYEEYRENVFRWAVEIQGIEKSQRTVGLNISRGIIELLSAYLHKNSLIPEGKQLNHRWFKSESVAEKLPDFPNRENIVKKMVELENLSEILTYGAQKPLEMVKKAIDIFIELESDIKKMTGDRYE